MLLLFRFVLFSCFAYGVDFDFIESKPKGIVRDFYIYESLQGDITEDEALRLYDLIEHKTPKIIGVFKSKVKHSRLPRDIYCRNLSYDVLRKSDDDCFNMGFKLSYVLNKNFNNNDLKRIKSTSVLRQIDILQSANILDSILDSNGEDFSDIYYALSTRRDIFNRVPKDIMRLSNKNYGMALYHLIISNRHTKFTNALLKVDITGVNDWSSFALGLNELRANRASKAKIYFSRVQDSKNVFLRDRALFWLFKITNDTSFLKRLASSKNFNLYSLYAHRKLNLPPNYEIITRDDPIFSRLKGGDVSFDIADPFQWQILSANIALIKDKDSLLDIAKLFYFEETLPHLIFVLNRYFNYSKNFFVMPYYDELDYSVDTKTLLYAVAKQESKFLPSVVSKSYALGMMQIMPFNVSYFAKHIGVSAKKEDMFNPRVAIQFGAFYLEHLNKEFKHPLFVSYAYNGGPTFIRNHLKKPKSI